jgi:DNA helicase-2/ATP-dependent DNA helicase PcrA
LLKGLEAETSVVLSPELMDRKHLYVAVTRGSKQLVICSQQQVLNPN